MSAFPVSSVSSIAGSVIAPSPAPTVTTGSGQTSFAQLLDQISHQAVETLKSAEGAAISGVQGKLSAQAVVDNVLSAERTLQTVIALRDKAVGAYLEVSKMAI